MGNIIPIPHGMFDGMQGQNYEIDGAISFALEAVGEADYDYWFVAGLTGDSFNQIYYRDHWRGNSAAEVRCSDGDISPVLETFALCGYDCEFVSSQELNQNREGAMRRLMDSIDRGVPVIRFWDGWQMIVGYEDGPALLAIWGDRWGDTWVTPGRIEPDQVFALPDDQCAPDKCPNPGWFFLGAKRKQAGLAALYRKAIERLPQLWSIQTKNYCFCAAAFRAWADDIESGKYEAMDAAGFEANKWSVYTNYVCVMASNGSGYREFLDKALALNPDMDFLPRMGQLFQRMGQIWEGKKDAQGKQLVQDCLEQMGGGFGVTLETLKDPKKRAPIAAKLRECAGLMDELRALLKAQ